MFKSYVFSKSIIVVFSILILHLKISLSQINLLWQVSFNDSIPETNYSDKSKLDNEGNIIIMADGTNSTGSGVDYVIIKYNTYGVKLWNRRFNGTGNGSDYPADMVIDRENNIYVTGRSWGGATRNDYLTLKYSSDGELLWVRRFDWLVSRNDEAYSIALDSNENVYVTGFATSAYNGNELYDMVTVKYNSEGEQKWVQAFIGYGDGADWGYTVVCDLIGNIYVSGFTHSMMIGHDIITVKYDSLGNEIWQKRYYNKGDDYIRPLMSRVDAKNNLILVSYYKSDSTRMDYLTYKYDSSGNLLWSNLYDGERHNDWVADLSFDLENNIYVTGSCAYDISGFDYLTIKYSAEGQEIWHSRINDSDDINGYSGDLAASIAIDNKGNLLVFGTSLFWEYFGCTLIYNSSGTLLYKFKNYNIQTAISILDDKKNNIIINGVTGSKIFTAKYLSIITGINFQVSEPEKFSKLQQNYPNPFNPKTIIGYSIQSNYKREASNVKLTVYNSNGQEIRKLVSNYQRFGYYSIDFDGGNLPSGIYYYSLFIDNNLIETRKMLLVK